MTWWYWVSTPRATFGIGFRDGYVVETAGYGYWLLGQPAESVQRWLEPKVAGGWARVVSLGEYP